ncbi:4Fe-4S binding protein [Aquirufa sp. ROCK-SH2]
MSAIQSYFRSIFDAISSTKKGMGLTWKHLLDARRSRKIQNIQDPNYFTESTGIFTSQYPHIEVPAPVNGRYQLHNEMDDCIVCDKCVKVCPVDCIDIEPIKATELVGYTSDGSPIRLYAAKFDIDMAKCCFCGLCTTVCPTECLTMTSEYDFATFDITTHNFSFANLSAEEAEEKKRLYEQFVAEKEAMKAASKSAEIEKPLVDAEPKAKPAFKPSFKAKVVEVKPEENQEVKEEPVKPKPAFKPSFKAKVVEVKPEENQEVKEESVKPKPAFKPSFKPKKPNPEAE